MSTAIDFYSFQHKCAMFVTIFYDLYCVYIVCTCHTKHYTIKEKQDYKSPVWLAYCLLTIIFGFGEWSVRPKDIQNYKCANEKETN